MPEDAVGDDRVGERGRWVRTVADERRDELRVVALVREFEGGVPVVVLGVDWAVIN